MTPRHLGISIRMVGGSYSSVSTAVLHCDNIDYDVIQNSTEKDQWGAWLFKINVAKGGERHLHATQLAKTYT